MAYEKIKCPHCGGEVHLTEALSQEVRKRIKAEFSAEALERDKRLREREAGVEEREKSLEARLKERLASEVARFKETAIKEARAEVNIELKDLRQTEADNKKRVEEAERRELELRARSREIEKKAERLDLDVARKIDSERARTEKEISERLFEQHRLKELEKTKQIDDLRATIEELRRKSEQGSMQTQGEVGEIDIEELLSRKFPTDDIQPVAKGVKGADIVQKVYTRDGSLCGTLLWEIKNTKAWSEGWIEKLKTDQREARAELAIIISKTLPRGVENFKDISGVWVSGFPSAPALAEVLRYTLVEIARSKASLVGRGEKKDLLYNYISGQGFRQRIEAIVDAFSAMQSDLISEKRAMTKIWAKREKQIERALTNSAGLYGDVQGITGAALPEIASLELGDGNDPDDTGQENPRLKF